MNPDSVMIDITGIDNKGNTGHFTKPLSQFTSKYTKSGCGITGKKVVRKILGIFKLRERNIYKKYIIE
ncbi:MAG: hypothetical protein IPJ81_15315 [Chitinophagaceae bacterium]|nr:hypothetical protein [Chitinophagaceae bacterium]